MSFYNYVHWCPDDDVYWTGPLNEPCFVCGKVRYRGDGVGTSSEGEAE